MFDLVDFILGLPIVTDFGRVWFGFGHFMSSFGRVSHDMVEFILGLSIVTDFGRVWFEFGLFMFFRQKFSVYHPFWRCKQRHLSPVEGAL